MAASNRWGGFAGSCGWRVAACGFWVLALSACGGGGGESAEISNPPPEVRAARVEIIDTGVLLTAAGQSRQLRAQAFDASGAPIDRPLQWSSSDPADLAVDANGLLTAVSGNGSSQITVQADAVSSLPLLAVVTPVASGTQIVPDAQILRGPELTDPDAEPSFDNTYTVILAGDAPALDSLLVGDGSTPLAGKVVNTEVVGNGVLVTMQLVSLPELFPELEINQSFDLSQVPVEIPAEVSNDYEITREGELFVFTARDEDAGGAKSLSAKSSRVSGTRAFESGCRSAITGVSNGGNAPLPIRVEVPPVFKFSINPTVDLLITPGRGLEKFIVKARPVFQGEIGIKLTAAFEGKITCKRELFVVPLFFGGPLSLLISGLIPVGIGLEAGGKITVADVGISNKVEVTTTLEAGMNCSFGDCDFIADLGGPNDSFTVKNTPTLNLPGLEDLRYEPRVDLFAFAETSIGNRFLQKLRFTALEARFGATLQGSFAPQITQMLAPAYKSNYRLNLLASARAGQDISSVLNLLGLTNINLFVLELTFDLANSPTGAVTASQGDFRRDDLVTFNVKLDPAKLEFLGLHNAREILLVRKVFNEAQLVRRVLLPDGRQELDIPVQMTDSGNSNEFFAFVVTRVLPLDILSLELGQASFGGLAVLRRSLAESRSFARRLNCTPSPCDEPVESRQTVLVDTLDQPVRADLLAQAPEVTAPGAAGLSQTMVNVPIDDTALFSRIALECNTQGQAQGGSDLDNRQSSGSTNSFVSFDVPEGRSVGYRIEFPPLDESQRQGNAVTIQGMILSRDPGELLMVPGSDASDPARSENAVDIYRSLENLLNIVTRFPLLGEDQRRNDALALSYQFSSTGEGQFSSDVEAEAGNRSGVLTPGHYSFGLTCIGFASSTGSGETAAGSFDQTVAAVLELFPAENPTP